jgi:hypothetical protein
VSDCGDGDADEAGLFRSDLWKKVERKQAQNFFLFGVNFWKTNHLLKGNNEPLIFKRDVITS